MDIEKMFDSNNYSFKKVEIPFDFINNTSYIINERKNFYVSQLTCDVDGNIEEILNELDPKIHDTNKSWDCFEFCLITDKKYEDKYHNYCMTFQGMRTYMVVKIDHINKTITFKSSIFTHSKFARQFLKNLTTYLGYTHIKKD